MDILIIGGNRFFGKKLARLLLEDGHNLTLLNRGNLGDGLGDSIERITADRNNQIELEKAVEGRAWDLVYDQVCFDFPTAKSACEVFNGKTNRYIFTSTQSVYKSESNTPESSFDPRTYTFENISMKGEDYSEGKRQAEVGFEKNGTFKKVYVRFPIVIGTDDHTERLKFHIAKITKEENIYFPNIDAKISLIDSDFAAKVLHSLATNELEGPINATNPPGSIALSEVIKTIENITKKKVKLSKKKSEDNTSPYGIEGDWFMNCSKLETLGLEARPIKSSLVEITGKIYAELQS